MLLFGSGSFILLCILKISLAVMLWGVRQCPICRGSVLWYIDLANLKAELAFFSCTSQGHNTLPRPGLETESSDSEPSALTTGLLNKAVVLACPRYRWPRMLKVAPCTVVRSYGRTSKFFRPDGLLLFCIIMGLRFASFAIKSQTKS